MNEHKFEIVIDGIPYVINVRPFKFNNQVRYEVSYNGGKEATYVWDDQVSRLMPIEDYSSTTPDDLIAAISNKIEQENYK